MNRRPTRSAAASPTTIAGFDLWRRAMKWQRAIGAVLRPLALTHTQFLVLMSLDRLQRAMDGAANQRQIATEAGLDEATTSTILRNLERRGLIDRGITHDDARAWRVILSSKGAAALRQALPLVDDAGNRFFAQPK